MVKNHNSHHNPRSLWSFPRSLVITKINNDYELPSEAWMVISPIVNRKPIACWFRFGPLVNSLGFSIVIPPFTEKTFCFPMFQSSRWAPQKNITIKIGEITSQRVPCWIFRSNIITCVCFEHMAHYSQIFMEKMIICSMMSWWISMFTWSSYTQKISMIKHLQPITLAIEMKSPVISEFSPEIEISWVPEICEIETSAAFCDPDISSPSCSLFTKASPSVNLSTTRDFGAGPQLVIKCYKWICTYIIIYIYTYQ